MRHWNSPSLLYWLLWLFLNIFLLHEISRGTNCGNPIALASHRFRRGCMNPSLGATGEECMGPSGRSSLLVKKEKHDKMVHHSSSSRPGYMWIWCLQGCSCAVTRLKLALRRWQAKKSQEMGGVTLSYSSPYFQSPTRVLCTVRFHKCLLN